jgi:hypothetical protein
MDEFECMKIIDQNMQAMPDDATRQRVASWVRAKFLGEVGVLRARPDGSLADTAQADAIDSADARRSGEIPGIAKLSQSGDVQVTVRDFKAKSANDAAIRLVHVLIWATTRLTGNGVVSSKGLIVPWLRKYRCYDGNTRWAIAKDKGLVRDGDQLSLDFHAEQLAEKFVGEILDPAIEGRWKPSTPKRKVTRVGSSPRLETA